MALLDILQERAACKGYDATHKLREEDVQKVIEAIRLTPTSSGLQPFSVIRIKSDEARKAVVKACMNSNSQLAEDCSDILVLAAWDSYTEERLDAAGELHNRLRPAIAERFNDYIASLKKYYIPEGAERNFVHTARQAYIALGLALAQAAELGIDSTPIEGYNPSLLDEELKLNERGLKSVFVITLGKSNPSTDWIKTVAKVRRPVEELVIEL